MKKQTGEKPERSKKPPLTDAERHARFVAMAGEVDADSDPKSFDRAFTKVTAKPKPKA